MNDKIGMMMRSEYNNPGELYGLDGDDMSPELMGHLAGMDPVNRMKVIQRLRKKNTPSIGSRAEMEKFFGELPKHIKEQLGQGKLRLADYTVYSIKPLAGSKTIKLFEPQDTKQVGLRSISNAKLPSNTALLVSGIYLLQGVAASLSEDDIKQTIFSPIDTVGPLANGEFKLLANKKQLLTDASNRKFITTNYHLYPQGYYKLSNPRLIPDDVTIEFEIELGTVTGINPNTVLYVCLDGTATIP
ncbi:MAG: hypothetical protein MUF42_12150 [Cytophagaceae bacterium]|jgi:hypothetical protein|nr:hypothetical protein [Cytophagaceae bacterium]